MNRLSAIAALFVTACGGTPSPQATRTTLATAQASGLRIELSTASRLEAGMTPIWIKVTTDAGAVVHDASVEVEPMMTMGDASHAAPVIDDATLSDADHYGCAIVFSMPSSMMASWSLKVMVQRPGAEPVVTTFRDVTVADTGRCKSAVCAATSAKYVVSLNFDAAPRVGLNPVTVTVHRMEDMMTFVPVTDAVITMTPEMPSMPHGSPGSVNPTHTSMGRYSGKLSFSMPGDWVTTIAIRTAAGDTLEAVAIKTSF